MLHWSNFNVMNECVYILCISEDGTNSPKEKGPPCIYVPYPKIYPDLFQPKMSPTLSFSGMYRKSFIYRRNRTNYQ